MFKYLLGCSRILVRAKFDILITIISS